MLVKMYYWTYYRKIKSQCAHLTQREYIITNIIFSIVYKEILTKSLSNIYCCGYVKLRSAGWAEPVLLAPGRLAGVCKFKRRICRRFYVGKHGGHVHPAGNPA